jgi:hypothetical protein
MVSSIIKQPSAWIPIALSFGVLLIMFASFALSGTPTHQADEGTAAHLFQIWLVVEVAMIGFFGVTWLPKKPLSASLILIVQIVAVLAACAPIRYFNV